MASPTRTNLKIYQGSTFSEVFRWESFTKIYKPITGITNAAPVVITAVEHEMPIGWRFKVSNVAGMKEINTSNYLIATDKTADTITVNDLNTIGYSTYTSGGIIEYNEPKSLDGVTARMQIRPKVNSDTVLLELTSEIIVNDSLKTIEIRIPASVTEALTFKAAVYSMELVSGSTVTPFVYGNVTLDAEITR